MVAGSVPQFGESSSLLQYLDAEGIRSRSRRLKCVTDLVNSAYHLCTNRPLLTTECEFNEDVSSTVTMTVHLCKS